MSKKSRQKLLAVILAAGAATSACGGAATATDSSDGTTGSAPSAAVLEPGTLVASFPGLEVSGDKGAYRRTYGHVIVGPEDDFSNNRQLLSADGTLRPLPLDDFSEVDAVTLAGPDVLLVLGKRNGRESGVYNISPVTGEERYLLPSDNATANDTRMTEDFVVLAGFDYMGDCVIEGIHETATGDAVSWPVDQLSGQCILSISGNYAEIGEESTSTTNEKVMDVIDLATGESVSPNVLKPTNPQPEGSSSGTDGTAWVDTNVLSYNDGEVTWTLDGLPDRAEFAGAEFGRLAVSRDDDDLAFTIVDAATGQVVSTVETQDIIGAPLCDFIDFVAEDRMLLECYPAISTDNGSLYLLAV